MAAISPMLAKEFDPKKLAKWQSVYLQPKLDGMRTIYDGEGGLWTRTGKPIVSMPKLLEQIINIFGAQPTDGELYTHDSSFQKIIKSARRTVNIEENEEICYHVYDLPVDELTFAERYHHLNSGYRAYIAKRWYKEHLEIPMRIKIVDTVITSYRKKEELAIHELSGYEGTMARNGAGLYKFGKRSSDLLKIKTFKDAEFEVVGVEQFLSYDKDIVPEGTPGSKRYSDGTCYKDINPIPLDKLGALVLKTESGATVRSGSGFDDEERVEYWKNPPIGKLATIKFQQWTDGDNPVPRFPIFKCIRDFE